MNKYNRIYNDQTGRVAGSFALAKGERIKKITIETTPCSCFVSYSGWDNWSFGTAIQNVTLGIGQFDYFIGEIETDIISTDDVNNIVAFDFTLILGACSVGCVPLPYLIFEIESVRVRCEEVPPCECEISLEFSGGFKVDCTNEITLNCDCCESGVKVYVENLTNPYNEWLYTCENPISCDSNIINFRPDPDHYQLGDLVSITATCCDDERCSDSLQDEVVCCCDIQITNTNNPPAFIIGEENTISINCACCEAGVAVEIYNVTKDTTEYLQTCENPNECMEQDIPWTPSADDYDINDVIIIRAYCCEDVNCFDTFEGYMECTCNIVWNFVSPSYDIGGTYFLDWTCFCCQGNEVQIQIYNMDTLGTEVLSNCNNNPIECSAQTISWYVDPLLYRDGDTITILIWCCHNDSCYSSVEGRTWDA